MYPYGLLYRQQAHHRGRVAVYVMDLAHAHVRCLQIKDFVYTSSSVKSNRRYKKGFLY